MSFRNDLNMPGCSWKVIEPCVTSLIFYNDSVDRRIVDSTKETALVSVSEGKLVRVKGCAIIYASRPQHHAVAVERVISRKPLEPHGCSLPFLYSVVKPIFCEQTPDVCDRADPRSRYGSARDLAQAFGLRLTVLRKRAGFTVRDLAELSGLPSGTVGALCVGNQLPNLRQLLCLQRGFNMASIEELLGCFPSRHYDSIDDEPTTD